MGNAHTNTTEASADLAALSMALTKSEVSPMMVNIESRSQIHMQVNSADFGDLFAHMACDDQVSVLRAIVSIMAAHPLQWDYIAIELELPENSDLRADLGRIVAGMRIAP